MSKQKLFIFDIDGTLVNSRAGTVSAYVETFKECFGKDVSETDLYQFVGSHFDYMVSEFIGECSEEDLKKASKYYSDIYYSKYSNHVGLFPHVKNVLEKLSKKVLLSTATNMSQSGAENLLAMLGVADLFDKIVGTKNYAKAKPNPDMLFESIDELGIGAANTIMFGDSPNDIIAGKNAGVKTVAVIFGAHIPQTITTYKPNHIIQNFNDVLKLV